MDKLLTLSRFKKLCPFLGRTQTQTLRSLSTLASSRFPAISQLTESATKCPVMGPALQMRSTQMVAGYASVAAQADVQKIHHSKGIFPGAEITDADIARCPHASAARAAARMAEELAAAAKAHTASAGKATPTAADMPAGGCPFHMTAAPVPSVGAQDHDLNGRNFNYDQLFAEELEKKHKDQSYRYFNNINRLANKFPLAHTGNVGDEVEVWCANDYLGMGNNPVVLETMQYVSLTVSNAVLICFHEQPDFGQIWCWGWRDTKHCWKQCHAPCFRKRTSVLAQETRRPRFFLVLCRK